MWVFDDRSAIHYHHDRLRNGTYLYLRRSVLYEGQTYYIGKHGWHDEDGVPAATRGMIRDSKLSPMAPKA